MQRGRVDHAHRGVNHMQIFFRRQNVRPNIHKFCSQPVQSARDFRVNDFFWLDGYYYDWFCFLISTLIIIEMCRNWFKNKSKINVNNKPPYPTQLTAYPSGQNHHRRRRRRRCFVKWKLHVSNWIMMFSGSRRGRALTEHSFFCCFAAATKLRWDARWWLIDLLDLDLNLVHSRAKGYDREVTDVTRQWSLLQSNYFGLAGLVKLDAWKWVRLLSYK